MTFAEVLDSYMETYSISVSALSEASGLSKATISRFKNGKREPDAHGDAVRDIARALVSLAPEGSLEEQHVESELTETLSSAAIDFDSVVRNLNTLIDVLGININDLSRYLKFDPSYLSRIRSGQRKPADPVEFCRGVASFICTNTSEKNASALASITGCSRESMADAPECKAGIFEWLTEGHDKQDNAAAHFLQQLDEFDLNEYIQAIHFDELKVPTVPFQLPTSKNYYDVQGFMDAEIAWLRATVTAKSTDPVLMYSDMPMTEPSKDEEFPKKWMYGVALLLKKGLHLNVIHNIDRSFYELMLGLESWIPLYMTGQVSSYYLKGYSDSVFSHFLRVSGAAALSGEAIVGSYGSGFYHLTKNKEELVYYRKRGDALLKKARPLIEVFTEDEEAKLEIMLRSYAKNRDTRIIDIEIEEQPFKNISIYSIEGECVVITKNNAPKIHFVIRHPKLRKAIENITVPIAE